MLAQITDVFHPTHLVSAALGPAVPPFNFRLLLPFAVFPLLLIALLIVLPGVRDQRALSLLTIAVQLSVGALLIGSIVLPFWKVTVTSGSPQVLVHLQAFSRQRHVVRMGVAVGLHSLNISLEYIRPDASVGSDRQSVVPAGLFLNEQFKLDKVSAMADEMHKAFTDGVPFPVLKVLEYFSMGQQSFAWARQFRNAGNFTGTMLWAAFFVWLVQCLLLLFLPHHFAKAGIFCGLLTLLADVLFLVLCPSDLLIPFTSAGAPFSIAFLHFRLGACFWMSIAAALLALFFSSTLCSLQSLRLYSLNTVLSASLDNTVGPPKCRFGGGRQSIDAENGQHRGGSQKRRFGRILSPITPCPSGKTSLTLSHCSLDNSSPAVSSRSTARISPDRHQRTFVSAPLSSSSTSDEGPVSNSAAGSNKQSVASSIFSISGTSFGSAAPPTMAPESDGTGEVISRRSRSSLISSSRRTTAAVADQQQQRIDIGDDEENDSDELISDDIKHFTMRSVAKGEDCWH
ncbi:hypothetical protein niasHS_005034 [Heterodera schachtii]|uniref:Uncharacterized protein n=1 Tax=Heterodera schachtii TaxID=97005 RepID=A0ABD2JKB4_HETSC